jgi:UDP-N-acetylmuramoyl-tripeptide--D-alanyl-D-alanine ligase
MTWTLQQAAQAMAGELLGEDAGWSGVSTDTRSLQAGELYFGLRGERFDGAAFAQAAHEAGAAGVVLNRDAANGVRPQIAVDDSRLALGRLGSAWRGQFDLPVVAVTGSNGKTTVKEMLAAILARHAGATAAVLATQGNLNNDIGLPLMLLRLMAGHRYAVLEMGMNHPGEIAVLTALARPDVALINNAQGAHIGLMGSVQAIAAAKGEIFSGLGVSGIAVINADDDHAAYWHGLNPGREIHDFGFHPAARVRGRYHPATYGGRLSVCCPQGEVEIDLQVPGEHNARNALAAITAALAVGATLDAAVLALTAFSGVKGRLQRSPGRAGAQFIDDTYNANPDSVRAALAVMRDLPGRRFLVLGDMGELGDTSAARHADIGLAARAVGIEQLFCLGAASRDAAQAFGPAAQHFETVEALLDGLEKALTADATVLVKGSRFMQMERVVKHFTQGGAVCS